MRVNGINISVFSLALLGCSGWQDSITQPTGVEEVISGAQKKLLEANNRIVEAAGLESGTDNPPFLSLEWIIEKTKEFTSKQSGSGEKTTESSVEGQSQK